MCHCHCQCQPFLLDGKRATDLVDGDERYSDGTKEVFRDKKPIEALMIPRSSVLMAGMTLAATAFHTDTDTKMYIATSDMYKIDEFDDMNAHHVALTMVRMIEVMNTNST